MGSQHTREVIPPPSVQVVSQAIEQMFIKNKTRPVTKTSIVTLKNLNLSDSPLKGGEYNSKINKYIHQTQNYLRYDPTKLIKDLQNGGKINSPSPDSFQKMSQLSPFREIKDHLLKTDFQNYQPKQNEMMSLTGHSQTSKTKPFVAIGGGDFFLNGLSESPATELPPKNNLLNYFMKGGIKEDSDNSDDSYDLDDLEKEYPIEELNKHNDSPINSVIELLSNSEEEYNVESTENNYSYSETSNNTHGILPFYSSDSSDHQFRHPYHKTRYG